MIMPCSFVGLSPFGNERRLERPRGQLRWALIQLPKRPPRVLAHELIVVERQSIQHRPLCGIPRVAERDRDVSEEAPPPRSLHRAPANAGAERRCIVARLVVEIGGQSPRRGA